MTLLSISQRLKPLILLICKIVNANGFLPLWKLMHRKKNFNELPGLYAYRYLSNVCHLSYRWGIIKKVRRKERQYLYKHFHAKMAQFSSCHNFIVSKSQKKLNPFIPHISYGRLAVLHKRFFYIYKEHYGSCKQHPFLNLFWKPEWTKKNVTTNYWNQLLHPTEIQSLLNVTNPYYKSLSLGYFFSWLLNLRLLCILMLFKWIQV